MIIYATITAAALAFLQLSSESPNNRTTAQLLNLFVLYSVNKDTYSFGKAQRDFAEPKIQSSDRTEYGVAAIQQN